MIEPNKPEINEEAVRYQARTVLADLAFNIANTRVIDRGKVQRASKIRLWCKALDYKDFLDKTERLQIIYKLVEISGINNFPIAPILQERPRPAILIGGGGGGGSGVGTVTSVDIVPPAAGISSIGGPITSTGSFTLSLTNDLATLEGLGSTGFAVRTATDTWAQRTLTGTTNRLTTVNGDGVSGNPTFDIAANYTGQSSITTLGTITTGVWHGTPISGAFGSYWPLSGAATVTSDVNMDDSSSAAHQILFGETNTFLRIQMRTQSFRVVGGITLEQGSNLISLGSVGLNVTALSGGLNLQIGSDATGDTYHRASSLLTRLPIGSTGQVHTVVGGVPAWKTGIDFAGTLGIGDVSATTVNLGTGSGNTNVNIGTSGTNTIVVGNSASTVNILGTTLYENVTNLQVADKLFTVNKGAGAGSATGAGFEIEENALITGYFKTTGGRDGWLLKAPSITNDVSFLFTNISSARSYTLPNANGTLAISASGNIALDSTTGNISFTGRLPFANLTQIAGLSILGVTGASTADVAAITGTTDQVFRVNSAGTGLSFGSIDLSKAATVGSSVLGVTNGGTGLATIAANRIPYATALNTIGSSANFTFDGTTLTLISGVTTGNGFDASTSTLSTGNLLKLSSTSTVAGSNSQTVLNIATSGANGTSTQRTFGAQITNTHTGTSSANVGLYISVLNGTSNYAAIFNDGAVGIGANSNPGTVNGTLFNSVRLHVYSTVQGFMVLDNAGGGGYLVNDTNESANNRLWALRANGSNFLISSYTDAGSATDILSLTRTGNITFGGTLSGASRTYTIAGSATDVGLNFIMKGAGVFRVDGDTQSFFNKATTKALNLTLGGSVVGINPAGADTEIKIQGTTTAGYNLLIEPGSPSTGNNNGGNLVLSVGTKSGSGLNGNIAMLVNSGSGTSGSFGAGEKVIFEANATTVPSSNPAGGAIRYVESGVEKYRDTSGNIITI